ncbi:DUF4123 domain-containing protein [Herbaspirillum seropedicae]|uniref:DUF4123 domain-containing protein n=1 Tax=Herbaspirillum seropedicae TaxID=964 RepID=UPI000863A692|nr:DUF4123 domain-containing protein [Herbaspirillum seropedicae]AON53071.1 hypothetical protein Hsc_0765 [Herbaspirillum seropedicae]
MSTDQGDPLGLQAWALECTDRRHGAYLLLDSAQAEGSHLKLQAMRLPYASLFDGKREEALPEIAPLLIGLSGLDAPRRERLASWISQLAFSAPCLSWYESPLPLQAFAAHLRNFHQVGLSDGQAMMMRWYDTRILPIWLQALTPEQRSLFTGGMFSIAYVDRFGEAKTIHQASEAGPPSAPPPLDQPLVTLDDQQFGLLVDAGDLDTLVNHLKFVIPDETRKLAPRTLLDFVAKYQQEAVAAGLDDIDRQAQYVLLALYTSGRGTAHPRMQALMADPPASLDAYYEAIQAMPEEVWEAGAPLWEQEVASSVE